MEECSSVFVWDVSEFGVEDTQCELTRGHDGPHTDGVIWWDDEGNQVAAPS
jgi:hypothetical protein